MQRCGSFFFFSECIRVSADYRRTKGEQIDALCHAGYCLNPGEKVSMHLEKYKMKSVISRTFNLLNTGNAHGCM